MNAPFSNELKREPVRGDALDLYLARSRRPALDLEGELSLAREIEEGERAILTALVGSKTAMRELAALGVERRAGKLRLRDLLRDTDDAEMADAETEERLAAIFKGAAAVARAIERGSATKAKRRSLLARLERVRLHRRILDQLAAAVREAPPGSEPRRKATLAAIDRGRRKADEAKAALVEANLGLVVMFAKRVRNKGLPLIDLIQEGNIGLMRAADKFDHRRGFRFNTYASWWIRQQMTRALADQGKMIRVPVHLVESRRKVSQVRQAFVGAHGREPDEREIQERTGLLPEQVRAIGQIVPEPSRLDAPVGHETETTFMDFVADHRAVLPDEEIASTRMQAQTRELLHGLSPREQEILRMRFGLDGRTERTLQEIGASMSLSRERIRQIESEALRKLRGMSERGGLRSYLAA